MSGIKLFPAPLPKQAREGSNKSKELQLLAATRGVSAPCLSVNPFNSLN